MLDIIFKSRKAKAKISSFLDPFIPLFSNKYLFVIKNKVYYGGNVRIAMEALIEKNKNNKIKIYFYKDGNLEYDEIDELESKGVSVLKKFNLKTLWHVLSSQRVIVSHNPRDAHIVYKKKNRKIINLWHGVAIKRIELLMDNISEEKLKLLKNNAKLYNTVIASSEIDKTTNAKAFDVSIEKVKVTGLPRYEILKDNYTLSKMLQKEKEQIFKIKKNKKLILFAFTFREKSFSPFSFITAKEWKCLENFARENNYIIGIRFHPYDKSVLPSVIEKSEVFHLYDSRTYKETNLLLKYTDILVVDFTSTWVDFLLLDRPVLGYAKDFDEYKKFERGFVYNFYEIFPDKFFHKMQDLVQYIKNADFKLPYDKQKKFFHKFPLNSDFKQNIYNEIINI